VKRALVMVAAVAGYSLLEMSLLLSAMLPHDAYSAPSSYQEAVLWGQLLFIPGLAVMLSRIMYGRDGWRNRALTTLAVGAFGVPALVAFLVAILVSIEWVSSIARESSVAIVVFILLAVLIGGSVTVGLFFVVRRTANRSVQFETKRWLADRQSGADPIQGRWRNRGIRWSSCVPSVMVLLLFLFLPEVWGILSHFSQPQSDHLSGYRVPIPATWIVLYHTDQPANGESRVSGLVGRGIGMGVTPYLHSGLLLSAWEIKIEQQSQSDESAPGPWAPRDDEAIDRHAFTIGDVSVTCYDYWPSYMGRPKRVDALSNAYVQCSGESRFYASLVGNRNDVPGFYRMLDGITQAK
jgi:hypothetical protein